jgi:hypothetical protein
VRAVSDGSKNKGVLDLKMSLKAQFVLVFKARAQQCVSMCLSSIIKQ